MNIPARCVTGTRAFDCMLLTISPKGCFVATDELVDEHTPVVLVFAPPGAASAMSVTGLSLRVSGKHDDRPGFGVAFSVPLPAPRRVRAQA